MIDVRHDHGVFLPGCGLWLDPRGSKQLAFVSHAHSDHTGRHGTTIATPATLRLMEARMGTPGRREFVQVLRLMEDFHQHQVEQAVAEALRLGAISFDAVKMLLLAKLENRPARLDLTFYPYLPAATVGATDTRAYLGLVANAGATPASAGASA
jgi:hypothetical protein